MQVLRPVAESIIKVSRWVNAKLAAVLFIIGVVSLILGSGLLIITVKSNAVPATLLLFVGLIFFAIDAYFLGKTKFLPFALLLLVWDVCYIGLYYVFQGASIDKTAWLYIGLIALAIFSRFEDANVKSAASISLYLLGIALFASVIILQVKDKSIGVGLIGTAIKYLANLFDTKLGQISLIKNYAQPAFDALGRNTGFEYYAYGFLALYWLVREEDIDHTVVEEKVPRVLSAYTLIIAGIVIVIISLLASIRSSVQEEQITNILIIGMGLLILLYGVNVIRGYKDT